jgi:hypothetical protein
MRVLAIDPGEKVGWATGLVYLDTPSIELIDHGIHDLKPFAMRLVEAVGDYDVVIYETWRLYAGAAKHMIGDDMQTSQLVGMIRLAAWLNPGTKLVSQSAAIKRTADKTAQDKFREQIENEPGTHDDAHDIDAVRHLWYWFWKNFIKEAANG